MKRVFPLFILAITLALGVSAQSGRRVTTPRSTPTAPIQPPLTPELELPSPDSVSSGELLFLPENLREREIKAFDSGTFKLSDFSGRVVVINLWASWCGPCRREVPEYEKVRKAYTGRDVEFIGLTTEDPRNAERVNKFLRDVSFGFRLGWADREMARTLMNGKAAIPQTLVLDGEGHVINHWTGYSSGQSGERLKQTIERAIKERKTSQN